MIKPCNEALLWVCTGRFLTSRLRCSPFLPFAVIFFTFATMEQITSGSPYSVAVVNSLSWIWPFSGSTPARRHSFWSASEDFLQAVLVARLSSLSRPFFITVTFYVCSIVSVGAAHPTSVCLPQRLFPQPLPTIPFSPICSFAVPASCNPSSATLDCRLLSTDCQLIAS